MKERSIIQDTKASQSRLVKIYLNGFSKNLTPLALKSKKLRDLIITELSSCFS